MKANRNSLDRGIIEHWPVNCYIQIEITISVRIFEPNTTMLFGSNILTLMVIYCLLRIYIFSVVMKIVVCWVPVIDTRIYVGSGLNTTHFFIHCRILCCVWPYN